MIATPPSTATGDARSRSRRTGERAYTAAREEAMPRDTVEIPAVEPSRARPCVGLVDVEMEAMELHDIVLALAAINGEITGAITDDELDQIRRALIWRALEASRKLQALF
jgi:hypothetical protein